MSGFNTTRDGIGGYELLNGERRFRVVIKVAGRTRSKGGFRTKGDARAWRDRTRSDIHRGEYLETAKGRTLFGDFADEWIATADLKPSSRAVYESMMRRHLAQWRDVPLANITQTAVRRWVGDLRSSQAANSKTVLARSTVAKQYRLLKRILGVAVREGYLGRNPCEVDLGPEEDPELYCPSPEEVMAIANAIPTQWRALVLLAGLGGLRWGELVGLRRRNVDVLNRAVHVREQVVELVTGELVVQTPKTRAGRRTVKLPPPVVDALALHLVHYAEPGPDGLVFAAPGDGYLRRSNFGRRVWRPALKAAGVPRMRFHDLRHAAATLAAQAGATTAELMAQIGHATPRAAMRYQHAQEARMEELAARIGERIDKLAATGTDNVVPLRPEA